MTAGIDLGSSNCNLEVSLFSRKLAVASSGLLLLPQGRGSSDSNTDFSREPPQAHGTFWSGLGSRWPWAQILPGSRQSVLTISKPTSHMNLRAPPGLKFFTRSMQVSCNHNRKHILSFWNDLVSKLTKKTSKAIKSHGIAWQGTGWGMEPCWRWTLCIHISAQVNFCSR